jgi:uncharacterized RDD family membrane protein YckC
LRAAPENPAAAASEALQTPAPHGLRAAAFLVDTALVVVLFFLLPGGTPWITLALLFVAYHTVFTWLVQRTVGKTTFSLSVQRVDKRPTMLWALGRSLGYLVIDVLLLGSLTALFDRRHRALHDLVFASEVVHEPGRAARRLDRLVELAESSSAELERRKKGSRLKPVFVLFAFWGSLAKLAEVVGKAVTAAERVLAGIGAPSAASAAPAGALSVKTAALVAVGATAMGAATVAAVPPLRHSVDGLAAPRAGEHHAKSSVRLSEIDEGDCIESLPASQIVAIDSVIRIDCDQRHEAEAFIVLEYDEGPFPGQSALQERAKTECGERFDSDHDLDWTFLVPYDDATWSAGYRQITCLAFRKDREPMAP